MPDQPELEIMISENANFAATGSSPLEKAKDAFESLAATLKKSVLPLQQALAENAPDEFELRFDLAFKGEAKWVVISTGGEATIGVTLLWKRK